MSFLDRSAWTITADSVVGGDVAVNCIDTNTSNAWTSANTGSNHWLEIDFGSVQSFNCFWWYGPGGPWYVYPLFVRLEPDDTVAGERTYASTIYDKIYELWPNTGPQDFHLFHCSRMHSCQVVKVWTGTPQINCRQLYFGTVERSSPYRHYFKAYSTRCVADYPGDSINRSIIEGNNGRTLYIKTWKTTPLGDVASAYVSNWRLPAGYIDNKINIDNVEYICEADTAATDDFVGHVDSTKPGSTFGCIYVSGPHSGVSGSWPTDFMSVLLRNDLWQRADDSVAGLNAIGTGTYENGNASSLYQIGDILDDYSVIQLSDQYLAVNWVGVPSNAFTDSATGANSFAH